MDLLLFGNLVAHALQVGLLTLGAAVLARFLRRLHPQLTLLSWQAVLVATAVLPFAQPWTPVSSQLALSSSVVGTSHAGPSAASAVALPGIVLPILGALLVVGVVVRLVWIGMGLWQLRRLVRETVPLEVVPDAVQTAMLDSGTRAVFRESDLPGPVSFGVRRGVVLLPRHFSALEGGAQYLVALHELLHVRRRDALQCLIEEFLVALFWFYPWVWWVRSRIRLAREQVVDRATAGTRPVRDAYVRTLLAFAGHHPRPLPTASGMWRANELRARIDALYKEVTMSRSRLLVAAATAAMALVSFAALGAATFPFRTAPLPAVASPEALTLKTVSQFVVPPPPPPHRAAQQEEDVVTVGGDVNPPVKIKDVKPVYPEDAKEAGIQGVVIIEAVIAKDGKVASAKVVRSIPELDQAALDAVLQWEFEPTYVKGKAVAVRMTVTINFTLA